MANKSTHDPSVSIADTKRILETVLHPDLRDNPLAYITYAFPWKRPNTPLANRTGPNTWQREELIKIGEHIAENKRRMSRGEDPLVYKCAIASGRGIGKSTFVAWVTLWFMSCVPGGSTVITANTDSQLTSKTFGEIGKWLTLAINGFCFDRTQKKITAKDWYAQQLKQVLSIDSAKYYAEGTLWNSDNVDAFAGEHSSIGMLLIFDEASGIPQPIWDVSDGFFTDLTAYRFWFTFSNPRSNTGAFFECFHKFRSYWRTRQIDARTVEGLDKATYDEIIAKHGEDSDQAKVEVKGQFPSQGDKQFISRGIILDAQERQLERYDDHAALVIGCDPARYGDDCTVICFRRGRDARSIPSIEMKGANNMQVANKLAELIDQFQPDGVFVDAGAGAGIIDRLKERGYSVYEVGFGTSSSDEQYADHRTELWGKMRDWIGGAMLDSSQRLLDDLTGPEYEFTGRNDLIKLEAKEKMKKRGLASPDHADALALTFHLTLARYDNKLNPKNPTRRGRTARGLDYKIFGGDK